MTATLPDTLPTETALTFKQGDHDWERLRKRSLTDLYWFASVVLGYANHFPYELETHLVPTRFLERSTGIKELDEAPKQLVLWPREVGKSSIKTVASVVQEACSNPDAAILIAAVKAGLAQDFLKTIKYHFENNNLLRALFPELIPDDFRKTQWSNERATLKRTTGRPEPTFDTIGVGGSVVGKHYDHIICDDLIDKDVADSIRSGSLTVLEDVNLWVKTLEPLLSVNAVPFPRIDFIGTRWWAGDTYDYIERTFGYGEEARRYRIRATLPNGKTVSRVAYRVGDLAIMKISGLEEGVPQFPKIWSKDRMDRYRQAEPELFAAFVMNDPADAAVRLFKDEWLHYWSWIDNRLIHYRKHDGTSRGVFVDNLQKVMCVDPAFTASGSGSRSAIVITGTDREEGIHLVLEAVAQRCEPRDLVADILHYVRKYKVSRVFIESVAQQQGFIQFVQSEARRVNLPVTVDVVKPGGRAKDVRIEGLAAYLKSGQLYINAGHTDLLEEYRQYKPGAVYKDLLDALAYCTEKWPMGTSTGFVGDARQRTQLQLNSYYQRRGLKR